MVFNIYNSSIFDKFLEWDERDMNVNSNTIDRFIEKSSDLRIITCYPFLVGHKENLNSSLWNGQSNVCYTRMVAESEARLLEDIERYKTARELCDYAS